MKRLIHMFVRLRPFSGRTLLFVLMVVSTFTIVVWTFFVSDVSKAKQCFRLKPDTLGVVYFEDVLESKKHPTPGKSIFFHETSCATDGLVHLNARYK